METITSNEFCNRLAATFKKVDEGETVMISHGRRRYKLMPEVEEKECDDEPLVMTPELQAQIDKVRQEYREGKYVSCRTHEEITAYLNSL